MKIEESKKMVDSYLKLIRKKIVKGKTSVITEFIYRNLLFPICLSTPAIIGDIIALKSDTDLRNKLIVSWLCLVYLVIIDGACYLTYCETSSPYNFNYSNEKEDKDMLKKLKEIRHLLKDKINVLEEVEPKDFANYLNYNNLKLENDKTLKLVKKL